MLIANVAAAAAAASPSIVYVLFSDMIIFTARRIYLLGKVVYD
jgi:hypothetical protein